MYQEHLHDTSSFLSEVSLALKEGMDVLIRLFSEDAAHFAAM
jgi:hypothetical protein